MVGVRMLPWYWRWLVDRVVTPTDVSVYVDGELAKDFSNRRWRPELVSVGAGEHVVAAYGTTMRSATSERTGLGRRTLSGPRILVEHVVEVGQHDVVSVSFSRVPTGDWPEPRVGRRTAVR